MILLEGVDGLVGGLVFKRDEAGTVGGLGPAGHLTDDALLGGADAGGAGLELSGAGALTQTPIVGILVPHYGLQTEHLGGDRTNAGIDVTLRRTPVHRDGTGQIVDDLHGPAEIAENLEIRLARLKSVRPGVNTKVHGRISLDVKIHRVGVPYNGTADEEVGSSLLLRLEIVDEAVRLRSGAVVKGDRDIVIGSQPDITCITLLHSPRADVGHVGAGRVDGGTRVGVGDGSGDVGDQTGILLLVVAVDPSLGQRAGGRRVSTGRRVRHAVFGSGGELTLGDSVVLRGTLVEQVTGRVFRRVDKASLVASSGGDQRSGQNHSANGGSGDGETHDMKSR